MRVLKTISIPEDLWKWLEQNQPNFTKKLSENMVHLIKKEFDSKSKFDVTTSLIKRKAIELSKLQRKLNETKIEMADVVSTIELLEKKRKSK